MKIDLLAELTLPDMEIAFLERALRSYVKPLYGKAYYRFELAFAPNEPIEMARENIRTRVNIDEYSLFGVNKQACKTYKI